MEKVLPRADYHYRPQERIQPRDGYKAPSLHTRALSPGGPVKSVEAEWCPVCLGREVSERLVGGRPFWHCDTCGNEW